MIDERNDSTPGAGRTRLVSRAVSGEDDRKPARGPNRTDVSSATIVAGVGRTAEHLPSSPESDGERSHTQPVRSPEVSAVVKPVRPSEVRSAEKIARPVKPAAVQSREIAKPAILLHDDPEFARDAVLAKPVERSNEKSTARNSGLSGSRTTIVSAVRQEAAVTGWVVVISGPGKGKSFELGPAKNFIGRGAHNTVPLDFGDTGISRDKAAIVIYDETDGSFHLLDAGERNNVYHNGSLVLTPVALKARDKIKVGSTVLEFVPFCGPGNDWADYQ